MKKLRIIIDDEGQCRAQRAVLAAFATTLPASAKVVWSSALPAPIGWRDAPTESARRLAARTEALAEAADTMTVFIPGHVIPGGHHEFMAPPNGAASAGWTTASDLDLFVVDNDSLLAVHYAEHRAVNPDYQSGSSYLVAGFASVPSWLTASGLASALLITQRPWYFAQVPGRAAWLRWLAKAFEQKLLTLDDVEVDVLEASVRPSLLEDARVMANGGEPLPCPDTTLDALFVCPEIRLTDRQHAMLYSRELQERTLRNAKLEALRKKADEGRMPLPLGTRLRRRAQSIARWVLKKAYYYFSITLRPLIRGSDSGQPRS